MLIIGRLVIGRLAVFVCGTLLFAMTPVSAADNLKIGMVAEITTSSGATSVEEQQVNGAKLAIHEVNGAGGVLGRPMELIVEDIGGTEAGAVSAFGRLAGDPEIAAFIGPDRSAFVHAIASTVARLAKPMMFGGTDPKLTRMGNPWLFRFRPNDIYSAGVIADFGVNDLGRRRWAIVHVDDAYGNSGETALTVALKAQGVDPIVTQGYPADAVDFTPVLQAAKQSGADLIASYLHADGAADFAKQWRQHSIDAALIGSPTLASTTVLKLAGPALDGTYSVADFSPAASPVAQAFARNYQRAYGIPADMFAAWTYDAVGVLAKAIEAAGSVEPDRIRSAILAVHGYGGAEGTYKFDQNGDGLHGYNIVHNDNGSWAFVKRIDFKD